MKKKTTDKLPAFTRALLAIFTAAVFTVILLCAPMATQAQEALPSLNESGEPACEDDYGYAYTKNTRDKKGRIVRTIYYDKKGKPAVLWAGQSGYAYSNFDGDGNPLLCTFLDAQGKAFSTRYGVRCIRYTRYAGNKQVKTELYFDKDGKSVMLEPGVYGYRYENYDSKGLAHTLICLNKDAKACVNLKGYAVLRRTFDAEGKLKSVMYYDLNGRQVKLANGQYGAAYRDGETIPLNAEGDEKFILSRWLHDHLWIVALSAIGLIAAAILFPRRLKILLGLIYIVFILYMTLAFRDPVVMRTPPEAFWSYKLWFTDPKLRLEIIENIALFLPLGFIAGRLISESEKPRCANVFAALALIAFSACIETAQYVTGRGLCEIDDIASNGLGAAIGLLLAVAFSLLKRKSNDCRKQDYDKIEEENTETLQ